jgi:hypothetical protein
MYVISYNTESGDEGIIGYIKKKPTDAQMKAYFKKTMPDEFEDGHQYVYWHVESIKEISM